MVKKYFTVKATIKNIEGKDIFDVEKRFLFSLNGKLLGVSKVDYLTVGFQEKGLIKEKVVKDNHGGNVGDKWWKENWLNT